MKMHLQCWFYGRLTINHEISNITHSTKISDLLNIYFNQIINPATNPSFTWDYCYPKMKLCGPNDIIYDKDKTIGDYSLLDGSAVTVLCGFNY